MAISNNFVTSRPSLYLNFVGARQLDPRISFSRASTGTYIDAEGTLRTVGVNEPRFDYENGLCKGLLIESERINVIPNSSNLKGSNWYNPVGVTTVTDFGNYQKLEISTDSVDNMVYLLDSNTVGNIAPNRIKVCYADMKAGSVKYGYLVRKATYVEYNDQCIVFNLETGVVTFDSFSIGGSSSSGVIALGNGFYRCWAITQTVGANGVQDHFGVGICNSPTETRTKSVGNYIYVARVQYETKANTDYYYPTSYIPTTTTTVTRAADLVTINDLSWFNDTEGTFVVDTNSPGISTQTTLFSGDNGTSQIIGYSNRAIKVGAGKTLYSTLSETEDTIRILSYSTDKNVVISSSSNEPAFFSTITGISSNISRINIGYDPLVSNSQINGALKSFRYYPTQVSDTQLQSLVRKEQDIESVGTPYTGTVGIATTGLILNLDVGISTSYVGTGVTWYDLSGSGNNGTLVNGVGYTSSNGGSLAFDGVDDYVNCGPVLNFGGNTSVGTICVVSKGSGDIFSNQRPEAGNSQHGWVQIHINSTRLQLYIDAYNTSPFGELFEIPLSLTPYSSLIDRWNFYSIIINRPTNTYILGINNYFITISRSFVVTNYNNFNIIEIGRTNNSTYSTTYFTGNIAQASIYNRALTQAEVLQNYNATKSRFISGEVNNYYGLVLSLDSSDPNSYVPESNTWYDLSGNGNNATLYNTPKYISNNGGVLTFDDKSQYGYVSPSSTTTFGASTSYTISLWFKLNNLTRSGFDSLFEGNGGARIWFYLDGSNNLTFNTYYGPPNPAGGYFNDYYQNIGPITDTNKWYNALVIHDKTNLKQRTYFNGNLSSEITLLSGYSFVTNSGGGFYINNGVFGLAGSKFAKIEIYNRVLSDTEISYQFNNFSNRFGL